MKKLLIMSDSHSTPIEHIIKKETPTYTFHAGDSQLLNGDKILNEVDYIVAGNCDFTNFNTTLSIYIKGIGEIFLTHGHLLDVKLNTNKIVYECLESNYNLCIYGHTHVVHIEYIEYNDLLIINPGSTAFGRSSYGNSYVVLEYSKTEYNVFLKDSKKMSVIKSFHFKRSQNLHRI